MMIEKVKNYLNNKNLKIIYMNNLVNIVNYDKILDINSTVASFLKDDKLVIIRGNDLKINKLLDNEVVISGLIDKIEL